MELVVDKGAKYLELLFGTILVLILIATPIQASADDIDEGEVISSRVGSIERDIRRGKKRIAFDVAENGSRFVFDEAPIDANGFPLYGNPFITQGFIYPAGTLDPNDPERDGVELERDSDGNILSVNPESSLPLLGIWICYGTVFAQDGFNIESGPTVISTQLYEFKNVSGEYSKISLTSNGFELIDLDTPVNRALIGGTGPYRKARGQIAQTFIGINETEGFVLRFEANMK